jgi:predicted O-linked N-acetylglucosamine transferase (SPINDLY family)
LLSPEPNTARAWFQLGTQCRAQGKLFEAIGHYQRAVGLEPDFAHAQHDLGVAYLLCGRLAEAETQFRRTVELAPVSAPAHNSLGIALMQQGKLEEAQASYQQAVDLRADFTEAFNNLAFTLAGQGRVDEAVAAYRTALQLKPDAAPIHSNLVFYLHFLPDYDAAAILEEARRWNERHAKPLRPFIRPHSNARDPERRLRVAYVSSDFRNHPASCFTVPLLAQHDRGSFEIYAYADERQPDPVTHRLRGHADVWRNTLHLSHEQLAELIRRDQIDILVDLAMHMAANRLLVFARKPAPVQVTWLAYPGTTGLSTIDYRLTDPYLDPPGLFDACYTEESVRLADTYWCYDPLCEPLPIGPLPALRNGYVTFGCLNNFYKINDPLLALWARVLQAVPQSRLLLLAPRGAARDRILDRFEQAGLAAERVHFADKRPRPEYLRLYQEIDLGLDPVPYNGHTTSLDAFWMGVPTITLVGQRVVGRGGWSQLCNLGLKDLAAQTPEQYVGLAGEWATDSSRLAELRATLRQRMQQSPLMDVPRFTRQIEAAYRQMWRRWCHGR